MKFPNDLQYTEEHVWIETDGETAKIGVTEYATDQFGRILYLGLPDPGREVVAGEGLVEIEFSEMLGELSSPLSGEVILVNEELSDSPELISDNAYEAWILELRIADPSELDDLLSEAEYENSLQ